MSKGFSVGFRLSEKNILDIEHETLNCAKQNPTTRLLALGTSEGILKLAKFDDDDTKVYSKLIYPQQINSVDWLENGLVCMSLNTPDLTFYNPIKDKIFFRQLHTDDIKNIREISNNEVFSWYRDGMTILVDLRAKGKQIELKSKNNVTCVNINRSNRNIIYTTTTPGTCLNIWDIRYTKRGMFVSTSKQMSNTHTCDLEMVDGVLYTTDNLSNISKISANGNFKSKILDVGEPGRFGRLEVNEYFQSLFFVSRNSIYSLKSKPFKVGDSDVSLIGCTGSKNDLFVYSHKNIVKYKITPFLKF